MKKTPDPTGQTSKIRATATVAVFSIIQNRLSVLVTLPNDLAATTMWTLPEEMLNSKEKAEQTVRRTLSENFNLQNIYLEQVFTFDSVSDSPPNLHEIDIVYLALTQTTNDVFPPSTKYKMAQWRMPGALPKLSEKHRSSIKILEKKLNDKLSRTNIAKHLLAQDFTLSELQSIYESILGRDLDTRNFRNKMLRSSLLKSIGKVRGGANRPAALYRFVSSTKTFLDLP